MTPKDVQGFRELQSDTTLNGRKYTIERKIGEGGFGITYMAVQNGLNRAVCIKEYFPAGKCIRNTLARTVHLQGVSEETFEKYRQAFVKEAQTLATLKHPNIVEVIDVFDENNTSYMVMSFIEGESLQRIVDNRGKLPYADTVNYIAQITNAIGYIHERHILHRDIKPDNIMITPDHKAMLIDFGSAREFEHDKTQIHTSMLTHGYSPPEQYTVNSRKGSYTDIYALGATFYFALTGQVPVEAAARLTEKMSEPKELSPEIPNEANRTILKSMQIKADNRHQTIKEFMDDLRNVKPSTLVDETIGGGRLHKKWLWWIAVASVIVIVGWALLPKRTAVEAEKAKKAYTLPQTNRQFTYQGEFKDDTIPHGKGVAIFGSHIYEGEFRDGKMEGLGKITYTSGDRMGDIQEGRFINNSLDSGVFISPSNRVITEGTFRNGEILNGVFIDSTEYKISVYENSEIIEVKPLIIDEE
jgi:serine/threonine-protein kinase